MSRIRVGCSWAVMGHTTRRARRHGAARHVIRVQTTRTRHLNIGSKSAAPWGLFRVPFCLLGLFCATTPPATCCCLSAQGRLTEMAKVRLNRCAKVSAFLLCHSCGVLFRFMPTAKAFTRVSSTPRSCTAAFSLQRHVSSYSLLNVFLLPSHPSPSAPAHSPTHQEPFCPTMLRRKA